MQEHILFSVLLPSHPDLLPIIQEIREIYNIPEIDPDENIEELILSDEEPDWGEVKQEISKRVREIPGLVSDDLARMYRHYENRTKDGFVLDGLDPLDDKTRKIVESYLDYVYQSLLPSMERITAFYDDMTESILKYILTGKTRELPNDWLGEVKVINFMDEPMIMATAGKFSDPKEIMNKFRFEYTRLFGSDRPKITKGQLNTADYLRMKLSGKSIADIADDYILRNRSQFPKDVRSKAYRESKIQLEERLKKRMQRLQEVIEKLIGDKI